MKRIESIDITRGLVMVIMALDHVRDFMHTTALTQSPTDLQTTTTILFMTRWVTHLCAPTFVFLSGVSAYIAFRRNNNFAENRKFLLTRGIWLVVLEFTFVNFALWYDIHFRFMIMEVIAAIGLSFIILSFLLKVPSRIIGVIGLVIIFGHNLMQGVTMPDTPVATFLSSVLLRPSMMQISNEFSLFTAYPLIPWLGIMMAGFACGEFFEADSEKRSRIFLKIGSSSLLLFTIIRYFNDYGDPAKWTEHKSVVFSLLSFVNTTKYPPSLLFILLFLGMMFVVLSISEKAKSRFTSVLSVYGKVPLFYFIIHLYVIHSLMFIMLWLQGFHSSEFMFGAFKNGRPETGGGVELAAIYGIWMAVVVLMYPLCRWYARYKAEHPEKKLLRFL
jgi:uncharacterized membrane protein